MITIAGKTTQVGDELWHNGLKLWCKVVAPGIVEVHGVNNQVVKYAFATGGTIQGRKLLSWHQPIVFDVPVRDISKFQALLDTAYQQFGVR